ncbi:MAG: hypothetical protein A2Z38_09155 [Planctomycetes bacterium RBG_19FT_COMBO_48_8]|nr:MAG: hypothetical protein A2Z38_09155 [Planctomycetes bacterium RBG_19FT_COMBO_48_8]
MSPSLAVISTEQKTSTKTLPWMQLTRNLFPHLIATSALEESKARILTTDGSYEIAKGHSYAHEGTVILVVSPGKIPRYTKLNDLANNDPIPPDSV